jgi:hypothetical protein
MTATLNDQQKACIAALQGIIYEYTGHRLYTHHCETIFEFLEVKSSITGFATPSQHAAVPQGFSVKRVEGHGWIVDNPSGTRWVAYEETPAGELLQTLAASLPRASDAPAITTAPAALTDEQVKQIADTLGFRWFESPDEEGPSFFSHDGSRILNMLGMRRALLAANPSNSADGGAAK